MYVIVFNRKHYSGNISFVMAIFLFCALGLYLYNLTVTEGNPLIYDSFIHISGDEAKCFTVCLILCMPCLSACICPSVSVSVCLILCMSCLSACICPSVSISVCDSVTVHLFVPLFLNLCHTFCLYVSLSCSLFIF